MTCISPHCFRFHLIAYTIMVFFPRLPISSDSISPHRFRFPSISFQCRKTNGDGAAVAVSPSPKKEGIYNSVDLPINRQTHNRVSVSHIWNRSNSIVFYPFDSTFRIPVLLFHCGGDHQVIVID